MADTALPTLGWVDWTLLDRSDLRDLHDDVRRLLALRRHLDHEAVRCHGVQGGPDYGYESRSLAWHSGAVYVMANTWWEPLEFAVQAPGGWRFEFASSPSSRQLDDGTVLVAPRSVVVLFDESSTT